MAVVVGADEAVVVVDVVVVIFPFSVSRRYCWLNRSILSFPLPQLRSLHHSRHFFQPAWHG